MSGDLSKKDETVSGITSIMVSGYKSIAEPREIQIRRLTLLCGANSSGKSSIFQPVLLLKQTLDAPYDPGALRISGPNVVFTKTDQFLSRMSGQPATNQFSIRVGYDRKYGVKITFKKDPEEKISIKELDYWHDKGKRTLRPGMTQKQIEKLFGEELEDIKRIAQKRKKTTKLSLKITRRGCFLGVDVTTSTNKGEFSAGFFVSPAGALLHHITAIIHVPGLRGNPERTYRTTAVPDEFPGVFSDYVASIIHTWQNNHDERLKNLGEYLKKLNLTCRVDAKAVDDT
ncbi:MAG: AAA family ATPase, partial [Proteobacteria bacterium]|nr:AAA family ATPase [Pseudomonadota bacterium]